MRKNPLKIFVLALAISLIQPVAAQNWDINLLSHINPQNPNSGVMIQLTNTVYPISVASPVALLATGYLTKNKKIEKDGWEAMGSLLINTVVTEGLKYGFNRERPYEKYSFIHPYDRTDVGKSFPSGHTSTAFATATTLSLEFKKWYVVVPAYAWATSVGYSRLYLGEHYPTDVFAGAVVGAGSAVLSHWLTRKIFKSKP